MKTNKNVLIKNIYYMMAYAFQCINKADYDSIELEEFDNIYNLFGAILSKGVAFQLKRGLYKSYVSKTDSLSNLRGKIKIEESFQNIIKKENKLCCEYDELTVNNYYNQILKSTMLFLSRYCEIDEVIRCDLKREILYFEEIDVIDICNVKWTGLRFERNNYSYKTLISFCELIAKGLILSSEKGIYKIATFIDEQYMCRLYEKFILEYYLKHYPQLKPQAAQIKWALDDGIKTMLPIMQSDIQLGTNEKILIIDAKYYSQILQHQYDAETVRSNNLYQIFTYVKNKQFDIKSKFKIVSGLLLYAETKKEKNQNHSYQMHGNRIDIATLNLNNKFDLICKQLDRIIVDFFNDGIKRSN